MADVFISYHRSEGTSALVRRIAHELESMGISCWYDTKDPTPGYFTQTIRREIESCKVFLLIWDEGANNSEWCLTETHIAFNCAARPIRVPFQVGDFPKDSDMDVYMTRCQLFNGGDFPENADIRNLIVQIASTLKKKSSKTANPPIIKRGSYFVTYTLDESGVLTVSGNGDIVFPGKDVLWADERNLISVAQMKKGITTIGELAFNDCKLMTRVMIPDGVNVIGKSAFRNCYSLPSVTIPNSVRAILSFAFQNCSNLKSVTIPDSVVLIDDCAFDGCSSLERVSVPRYAKIAADAFPETTTKIPRE